MLVEVMADSAIECPFCCLASASMDLYFIHCALVLSVTSHCFQMHKQLAHYPNKYMIKEPMGIS